MAASDDEHSASLPHPLVIPEPHFCDKFFAGSKDDTELVDRYRRFHSKKYVGLAASSQSDVKPYGALPDEYPARMEVRHVDEHVFLHNTWKSLVSVEQKGLFPASMSRMMLYDGEAQAYVDVPCVAVQSPPVKSTCIGGLMEKSNVRRMIDELKNRRVDARSAVSAFGMTPKADASDDDTWNLPGMRPDRMRAKIAQSFSLVVNTDSDAYRRILDDMIAAAFSETKDAASGKTRGAGDWRQLDDEDRALVRDAITRLLRVFVFMIMPSMMGRAAREGRTPYMMCVEGTPVVCDNPIAACAFLLAFMPRVYGDDKWPDRLAHSRFCQHMLYRVCYNSGYMSTEDVCACMSLVTCRRFSRKATSPALMKYTKDEWMPQSGGLARKASKKAAGADEKEGKAACPSYSMFSATFFRMMYVALGTDACNCDFDIDTLRFFRRMRRVLPDAHKKSNSKGRKSVETSFDALVVARDAVRWRVDPCKILKNTTLLLHCR